MKGICAIGLLLATSCTPANQNINPGADYEGDRAKILAKMNAELIAPMCTAQVAEVKTCGLLVFEYRRPQHMQAFEASNCGGGEVLKDPICFRQYAGDFLKAVEGRYTRAVMKEVTSKCDAAVDCTRWDQLEMAWLESHNDHVLADTKKAMEERHTVYDRQVEELDKQERQRRNAWATAASAMKGASDAAGGPSTGCANSMGCPMGHVCLIPAGASTGQCVAPK